MRSVRSLPRRAAFRRRTRTTSTRCGRASLPTTTRSWRSSRLISIDAPPSSRRSSARSSSSAPGSSRIASRFPCRVVINEAIELAQVVRRNRRAPVRQRRAGQARRDVARGRNGIHAPRHRHRSILRCRTDRGALGPPIIRRVNEFELIARFFTRPARASSVRLSVGDDAALLAPSPGLRARGFRRHAGRRTPFLRGHRPAEARPQDARRATFPDMAAMGASPRWALSPARCPDGDADWLGGVRARLPRARGGSRRRSRRRRHDARSAQRSA